MKKTAEVIIIGGGVNGCAAAYYLAKNGLTDVIVLEGDASIGHGGSSRNGGGVRQSGRDVRELPYVIYAIKNMWPSLSEELGMDVEYCQGGNLRLGKTEAHLKKLQTLTDNATSVGLDVRMLDGKEVREICPYLSEEVIGASWCPTDGHANPMKTTLAYYRKALELGVTFVTDASIVRLEKIRGCVRRAVTADGTVFEGSHIILAAGYESRYIARTAGIDMPLSRFYDEVLVTEMQPAMFPMMLGTADADFYGHQCSHGSFAFGGDCGQEEYYDVNGDDLRTHPQTASAVSRAIMRYIPALKKAKIVRTWGGWIDMCLDGVPVLGQVEEAPGLILAAGFTGHGFGSAPIIGQMLAQMAMGERTTLDLTAFRYDRFKCAI